MAAKTYLLIFLLQLSSVAVASNTHSCGINFQRKDLEASAPFRPVDAEEFAKQLLASSNSFFVLPRSAAELQAMTETGGGLYLSSDSKVGFGISSSGELISVFNASGTRGRGAEAVRTALALGARFLHCLEPLEKYYTSLGFARDPQFPAEKISGARAEYWEASGIESPRRLRMIRVGPRAVGEIQVPDRLLAQD